MKCWKCGKKGKVNCKDYTSREKIFTCQNYGCGMIRPAKEAPDSVFRQFLGGISDKVAKYLTKIVVAYCYFIYTYGLPKNK